MKGLRFQRLLVVDRSAVKAKSRKIYWVCRCDCGEEKVVRSDHLLSGKIRSCGCLRGEISAQQLYGNNLKETHRNARRNEMTPEYQAWRNMLGRCNGTQKHNYRYYGGRGISVCDRWLDSYSNFLADMGAKPSPDHSLDRIDNNGNYEPNNCQWATKKQQSDNRRPRSVAGAIAFRLVWHA